ncbi:MAG: hypothetical protein IPI81_17340 [Flavobacteriales bacterium]|nr:hypothetical protein [Flavobacteriales bacterium]MCC6938472.1 hypothetical protein [Flavobacteriales bacterium]
MTEGRALRNSVLLGLVLSAFSLALHFAPVWVTMLNRGAQTWDGELLAKDYIETMIDEHRSGSDISFRRRPLTTWCVDTLHEVGIPPKAGFIGLGFLLFFVAGLLVFRSAVSLGSTNGQALVAQGFFHLSPTVLFAWFDPMYTYDEPIQYVALIGALLAAQSGRTLGCIAPFTIATVAHETSLLFVPAVYLLLRDDKRRAFMIIGTTCLLFAAFLFFYLPQVGIVGASATDAIARLGTITFNFSSWTMTIETASYLVMTLALPAFLLWRFGRSSACSPTDRIWLRAFWITLLLNTALVLIAAKAREARVLALPLLLGWPLIGKALFAEAERHGGWRSMLAVLRGPRLALTLALVTAGTYFGIRKAFVLSTGIPQDNLYHEYYTVSFVIIVALLYLDRHRESSDLRAS